MWRGLGIAVLSVVMLSAWSLPTEAKSTNSRVKAVEQKVKKLERQSLNKRIKKNKTRIGRLYGRTDKIHDRLDALESKVATGFPRLVARDANGEPIGTYVDMLTSWSAAVFFNVVNQEGQEVLTAAEMYMTTFRDPTMGDDDIETHDDEILFSNSDCSGSEFWSRRPTVGAANKSFFVGGHIAMEWYMVTDRTRYGIIPRSRWVGIDTAPGVRCYPMPNNSVETLYRVELVDEDVFRTHPLPWSLDVE